jgi:hypothetical protein
MPLVDGVTTSPVRFFGGLGFDDSMPWLTRRRQDALAILMLTVIGSFTWLRYTLAWTPLQRQYLHAYIWTGLPFVGGDDVDVLVVVDGKQSRWALDEDVKAVPTNDHTTSFVLASALEHTASAHLEWRRNQAPATSIHAWLGQWIYGNQTLFDLLFPAVRAAFDVGLMFVILLLTRDLAKAQQASLRPWEHSPGALTRPAHSRPPAHTDGRSAPFFD